MTDVNEKATAPAPESEIAAKKAAAAAPVDAEVKNGKHDVAPEVIEEKEKTNGQHVADKGEAGDDAPEAQEKKADEEDKAEDGDEAPEAEDETSNDAADNGVEKEDVKARKRVSEVPDANGNDEADKVAEDEPSSKKLRTEETEVAATETEAQ